MTAIVRLSLAAAVAAALCGGVSASRADGTAPWCAVIDLGAGNVYWDCRYRTFADCQPNVLGGNRGFCSANPSYGRGG